MLSAYFTVQTDVPFIVHPFLDPLRDPNEESFVGAQTFLDISEDLLNLLAASGIPPRILRTPFKLNDLLWRESVIKLPELCTNSLNDFELLRSWQAADVF